MTGGLIAAALEQELLSELRRLGIVVWLDGTGYFTPFVDALAARTGEAAFAFPVVAFRGSFVELVLALEPFGSGLDNAPLLIHMPGFTEETIRKTPALELYEAGTRFRKAPDTLIREVGRGRVAPEALEQFLATGVPALSAADAWLDGQLTSTREGLAGLLEKLGILAVLDGAVEVLQRHAGYLANNVSNNAALEVFEAFLGRQTGMDAEWLRFFGENPEVTPLENAATALMGWLLSVEYVHDLARPPHLPALARIGQLSPPLVKACQGYVHHLREKHQDVYATIADEVELHLHEELPAI
ncbi:MAG: PglZ domain-containing protein, partial [Deltaproteobacteria bacterium]|nr:PglZ domain-containing protein [Deltaproteobacteria bacterium]